MQHDYYQVLNVSESATEQEIKVSYKKLVLEHHPDRNNQSKESEEKFVLINQANDVLSDSVKRQQYDLTRKNGYSDGHFSNNSGGFNGNPFSNGTIDENFLREFLKQTQVFNQTTIKRVAVTVGLTLQEILNGKEITLFEQTKACNSCFGLKKEPNSQNVDCVTCSGIGEIKQKTTTTIPPGLARGFKLVKEYTTGQPNNKIQYHIGIDYILPENIIINQFGDVVEKIKIDYLTMILGGSLKKTMFDDKTITIVIPKMSGPGQQLRLKERGIPISPHSSRRTNYLFEIDLDFPEKITETEKELFEKLRSQKEIIENDNNTRAENIQT